MHRVLVCGGRHFNDWQAISHALVSLDALLEGPWAMITGGGGSADILSGRWAHQRGIPLAVVGAQWEKHGKAAGMMRNGWMMSICQPTYGVAFPGGPGTADMTRRLKAAGVTVWEPYPHYATA